MEPTVRATLGWQIDSPLDVVGLIVIVGMVLFAAVKLVQAIGTGKLKPAKLREYFFGKPKPAPKDYPRSEPSQDFKNQPLLPDKYAREVLVLVERSIDHHDRLGGIDREALERQMRAFEELMISGMALLKKGFNEVCSQNHLTQEDSTHERKTYISIVNSFLGDLKGHFRKWCHANHFYEMDDDERRRYVLAKTEVTMHLAAQAFDDEWHTHTVTRDQLHQISVKYHEDLKALIAELFRRAFRASEEQIKKSNEEKAKYSSYVMAISGYDPYDITRC
jgi:hypothetical protein